MREKIVTRFPASTGGEIPQFSRASLSFIFRRSTRHPSLPPVELITPRTSRTRDRRVLLEAPSVELRACFPHFPRIITHAHARRMRGAQTRRSPDSETSRAADTRVENTKEGNGRTRTRGCRGQPTRLDNGPAMRPLRRCAALAPSEYERVRRQWP